MARQCSICTHPERAEIDEAIVTRTGSLRKISKDFGVSETSLHRHAKNHITESLTKAGQAKAIQATDLFEKLEAWEQEVQLIFQEAKKSGNANVALLAIDRGSKLIELFAKLKGLLKDVEVNVNIDLSTISGEITIFLQSKHPRIFKELMDHLTEVYNNERDRLENTSPV